MLDQTQAEMTDVSSQNIDDGKLTERKVFARIRELGKKEGLGDNSRPGVFLVMVEGAKKRAISKDHVASIFEEYSRASADARGVGWKRQDSEKQQVSKLGVAVRLGELPHVDGMVLMEKVVAFQKEQRLANDGKMDFSPFDGMVKVARYQVTKSPITMINDDVIRGLLLKDVKDMASEADVLERCQKALEAAAKPKEDGPDMSEASVAVLLQGASGLAEQIAALGGSTADRKRVAKAEAEVSELTDRAAQARARLVVVTGASA